MLKNKVWVKLDIVNRPDLEISGLYVIRCLPNGKLYVGRSKNIRIRVRNHRSARSQSSLLHRAIRKYGQDQFEICVFAEITEAELSVAEINLIAQLNCQAPGGYNLTPGGEGNMGFYPTDEVREKMRKAATGRIASEQARRNMSVASTGRVKSQETREKHRQFAKAMVISEATREKHRKNATGRKPSAETRAKMSLAGKGRIRPAEVAAKIGKAVAKPIWAWPPNSLVPLEFPSVKEAALLLNKGREGLIKNLRKGVPDSQGRVFAYAPK